MSFESQLIGQSTLSHDFRLVIYNRLQFFRIVFLWNKLLSLVELVTLLMIVVHYSVAIASFTLNPSLLKLLVRRENPPCETSTRFFSSCPQSAQKVWAKLPKVCVPLPCLGRVMWSSLVWGMCAN